MSPSGACRVGSLEEDIIGRSAAATELRNALREVANTDFAVLLQGETGAGKDVAARVLHRGSGRTGRFVPVNMAAIPSELAEAELFGAVRGAFTGADRTRRGLIEAADGGTLFLDEVGDLAPALQAQLLRFLESREVRAVGSTSFRTVDARVVSATHRDLGAGIREGWFRHDLYYRLAPVEISVPPLRDRIDDIIELRGLFSRQVEARLGLVAPRWSPAADRVLTRYHWPGNGRELRHVVEMAVVRAQGGTVTERDLGLAPSCGARGGRWDQATADFKRGLLRSALVRNNGNRSAAARELGISRQTLHYHLRQLHIGGVEP